MYNYPPHLRKGKELQAWSSRVEYDTNCTAEEHQSVMYYYQAENDTFMLYGIAW